MASSKAIQVKFQVEPDDVQLSRVFTGLRRIPENLDEPLKLIEKDFYTGQKKTFLTQGAFEGKERWAALSPRYESRKAREFPGKPILVRTGALRRAATNPGDPNAIVNREGAGLEVGIGLRVPGGWNLGLLHQLGTRAPHSMPIRKVIDLTKKQRARWVRIYRDFLVEEIDESVSQTRKFVREI